MLEHPHRCDFVEPAIEVPIIAEVNCYAFFDTIAPCRFARKLKLAMTQRASLGIDAKMRGRVRNDRKRDCVSLLHRKSGERSLLNHAAGAS
jgi:hypothetical protein